MVEMVFVSWEGEVGISADEAIRASNVKAKPSAAAVDESPTGPAQVRTMCPRG